MKENVIRARIDASLKEESARVLAACGLAPSEAIRMFLRQVVVHGGIPFAVRSADSDAASAEEIWAMKQASQSRDRDIAAREDVSGGELLLVRPQDARRAVIRWPSLGRK